MRYLMLRTGAAKAERGLVPYESLSDDDDMWTQWWAAVVRQADGYGEVWYYAPSRPRQVNYGSSFGVRWIPEFRSVPDIRPDVILARGGYPLYERVYEQFPGVPIVYYGSGKRYVPTHSDYAMVLVDCPRQAREVRGYYGDRMPVQILHKPAADNIFKPVPYRANKPFDVLFSCHTPAAFKGHEWLRDRLPQGARVLRIGARAGEDPWFGPARHLDVHFTGMVPRERVPSLACGAAVGIVCDDGTTDSGPRILPEYLAMDLPVLVRDCVRAPLLDYVTAQTGRILGDDDDLWAAVQDIRHRRPRPYYLEHLSVERTAERFLTQLREALGD